MITAQEYQKWLQLLQPEQVKLVAVSKMQPVSSIETLYHYGHRDFGENYVQELVEKQAQLPADIHWHFIGHLQSNKVKYIAPFVSFIHTVDTYKLLQEIEKHAARNQRVIDVLLQMHIAQESTKFGLDEKKLFDLLDFYSAHKADFSHVRIRGVMGMATLTDDQELVKQEFDRLRQIFTHVKNAWFFMHDYFDTCSMGMSDDYALAIAAGSNMIRVGSKIFGARSFT